MAYKENDWWTIFGRIVFNFKEKKFVIDNKYIYKELFENSFDFLYKFYSMYMYISVAG